MILFIFVNAYHHFLRLSNTQQTIIRYHNLSHKHCDRMGFTKRDYFYLIYIVSVLKAYCSLYLATSFTIAIVMAHVKSTGACHLPFLWSSFLTYSHCHFLTIQSIDVLYFTFGELANQLSGLTCMFITVI